MAKGYVNFAELQRLYRAQHLKNLPKEPAVVLIQGKKRSVIIA